MLDARGDHLRLILLEGDSEDNTLEEINDLSRCFDADIIKRDHHGPVFYQVIDDFRFAQLAYLGNELLMRLLPTDDVYIRLESDLLWQPTTMVRLIDHLRDVPAVVGFINHANGQFYDTYCYWRDGVRFTNDYPHHVCLQEAKQHGLVRLDSAGSCMAMRGDLARSIAVPLDVFVGVSRMIYEVGGSIWMDPNLLFVHPWRPGTEPQ